MKKYEIVEWGLCKRILFLFLYSSFVFSMEVQDVLSTVRQNVEIVPKLTISFFDFQKESEDGRLWDELVPGDLIITPDEKGVTISDHGRVRYAQFDTGNMDVIIRHQCIKKIPLLAVSQKQDTSLVVVSACNYRDELENKSVAEYAVYSHGAAHFTYVDFPIQAISLSAFGDTLAIADLFSVTVIDLKSQQKKSVFFKRQKFDNTHWIADIAMCADGKRIAIAGSYGDLQWMLFDGKPSNLKQVNTGSKIKKIYYPSVEELLYLTNHGEAKVVRVNELLRKDNTEKIDIIDFADSSKYETVAVDLGGQAAVAYWTDDIKMSPEMRQKIKVYCKDQESSIEAFILKFSDLEESYNYRTSCGVLASGVSHLLCVALRGKTVIGLATDGKMRLWSLGEHNKPFIETEIIKKEKRGRSDSTKIYPSSPTSSSDDYIASQKKNSGTKNPRNLSFKSLRRTRENSPTNQVNEKDINQHG